MKPYKKDVGKRIKEIRTIKNMTMEQFGSLIESSPKSTVNNWEKGNTLPSKSKLEKIALIGGTTVNQVLFGTLEEYVSKVIYEQSTYTLDERLNEFTICLIEKHISYLDDIKILNEYKAWNQLKQRINLEKSRTDNELVTILEKEIKSLKNIVLELKNENEFLNLKLQNIIVEANKFSHTSKEGS